jgi:hypothetical protein
MIKQDSQAKDKDKKSASGRRMGTKVTKVREEISQIRTQNQSCSQSP